MSVERFMADLVSSIRAEAEHLHDYGAEGPAKTCERVGLEIENRFRAWWLAGIPVAEASADPDCGYSEERLREMCREGTLPHEKGSDGRTLIRRCDLPRRPRAPQPVASSLEDRLLKPKHLRTPA